MSLRVLLRGLTRVPRLCTLHNSLTGNYFYSVTSVTQDFPVKEDRFDIQAVCNKFPAAEAFLNTCKDYHLIENKLIEAIKEVPEITHYHPNTIASNIEQFLELGFDPLSITTIILRYPYILNYEGNDIITTFETWRSCQVHERFLRKLFLQEPWLFSVSNKEVTKRVERLHYLMVHKINRVMNILLTCPDLLVADWEDVEVKFMYILKTMRYTEKEISQSVALVRPLRYIQLRHKFVERTGVYIRPMLKEEDSMERNRNPSLKSIIDTEDEIFAKNIAKVSHDEYMVFKKLMEHRSDIEDAEDEESNDEYSIES